MLFFNQEWISVEDIEGAQKIMIWGHPKKHS